MRLANSVLNEYKSNENAWLTADTILNRAENINSKFIALQILDEAINVSVNSTNTQSEQKTIKYCVFYNLRLEATR